MFDLKQYKNIYMIGIGGISMSGIAHILKRWNYNVSGSNNVVNPMVSELIVNGIHVNIGHNYDNINSSFNLVVYTAAIKEDNPELVHSKELGIEVMERGKFLGELTKLFKNTIGISGTHGKTTTTSLISECFMKANFDPTIQVGSILKSINSNYRVGSSDYFIIEACEYCDSFLDFHERAAIVLNIDNDHLDYFKNLNNIKNSFSRYVSHLPKDGLLILNSDDKNSLDIINSTDASVVTFGCYSDADYQARDIMFDDQGRPFYSLFKNNQYVASIKLGIIGIHNVMNSLACIALCDNYGININIIKEALLNYTGAARRFEYKGIFNGASVYDDYAHHPTEVKALANSVLNKSYNESWAIFEPHTYSRVQAHAKEFADSLSLFDNVIIVDIYAARENNIYDVNVNSILDGVKSKTKLYISDYDEIKEYLNDHIKENDIILTIGAGNITKLSDLLVK